MEVEPDEPALEPVVDGERKRGADVGIDRGLVVAVEQVQEAARVVGEPAAVRKVADETDARPAGRHHVLIGGAQAARIRQPHDVADLDAQSAFHDRGRNRIGDLRMNGAGGTKRHGQKHNDRQRCTHERPPAADYG